MKKEINITNVIKERFRLQTVQRQLSSFGVSKYNDLNKKFAAQVLNWDIQRFNRFIITLGGPVNKNKTINFINELVKE